jgi:hypothetical protein
MEVEGGPILPLHRFDVPENKSVDPRWTLRGILGEEIVDAYLRVVFPFVFSATAAELCVNQNDGFDPKKHDAESETLADFFAFYGEDENKIPLGDRIVYLKETGHEYFVRFNGPGSPFISGLFTSATSLYPILKKKSMETVVQMRVEDVYTNLKFGIPKQRTGPTKEGSLSGMLRSCAVKSGLAERWGNVTQEQALQVQVWWNFTRDEGTRYHRLLEKLFKNLALSEEEKHRLKTPVGKEMLRYVGENALRYYRGETSVTTEMCRDPLMWCMKCTGSIDAIYLNRRVNGRTHATLADFKTSRGSKNLVPVNYDDPTDEFSAIFPEMKGASHHQWYTLQTGYYETLYELVYPDHTVEKQEIIYFDQGESDYERAVRLKAAPFSKSSPPLESPVVVQVAKNPVMVAYLFWKRLEMMFALALEDGRRLERLVGSRIKQGFVLPRLDYMELLTKLKTTKPDPIPIPKCLSPTNIQRLFFVAKQAWSPSLFRTPLVQIQKPNPNRPQSKSQKKPVPLQQKQKPKPNPTKSKVDTFWDEHVSESDNDAD